MSKTYAKQNFIKCHMVENLESKRAEHRTQTIRNDSARLSATVGVYFTE